MDLDSRNGRLLAFFAGSLAAGLVFIGGPLLFLFPPECPMGYTQEQVDASGCNIGANIGGGAAVLLGLITWIITTVALAAWLYTYEGRK